MSASFYDKQAEKFAKDTLSVDMTPIYREFLQLLAPGSLIIDAGCGAGRDSHYFLSQGYNVVAFDASREMVKFASGLTGLRVICSTFESFSTQEPADAIWACASLLHVAACKQTVNFCHLASALRTGGLFYCSYKYGDVDYIKDGRHFTNATEQRLDGFLTAAPFSIKKCWITMDARPGRHDEKWLNAILEKTT